ncbi:MAG: hypothetical protein Q3994_03860 [Prevotella sp.]|nr:hypothetical protein [Prevotella sp.]
MICLSMVISMNLYAAPVDIGVIDNLIPGVGKYTTDKINYLWNGEEDLTASTVLGLAENFSDTLLVIPEGTAFQYTQDGGLTYHTLYQVVRKINEGAFANANVTAMEIGKFVKEIAANIANDKVKKLMVYWTSASDLPLPEVKGDMGFDYENCVLWVPLGTTDIYKSAKYWKKFKHIVEKPMDPDPDSQVMFFGNDATAYPYTEGVWPVGTNNVYDGLNNRGIGASVNGVDYSSYVIYGMYGKTKEEIKNFIAENPHLGDYHNYFDVVPARTVASHFLYPKKQDNYQPEKAYWEHHLDYGADLTYWNARVRAMIIKAAAKTSELDRRGKSRFMIWQMGDLIQPNANVEQMKQAYKNLFDYGRWSRSGEGDWYPNSMPFKNIFVKTHNMPTPTLENALNEVFVYANTPRVVEFMGGEKMPMTDSLVVLDCIEEAKLGKRIAGDYILANDEVPFQLAAGSPMLEAMTDVGQHEIAKRILSEIYKEDDAKRELALARIGHVNKINYINDGITSDISTTYESEEGGVRYGEWVKDGVINGRFDFSAYPDFIPYFYRVDISKADDGTVLYGKGYTDAPYAQDFTNNNANLHLAFRCYNGDMNIEPTYKVVLNDELTPTPLWENQKQIDLFYETVDPYVVFKRTMQAGVWNTICLPWDATPEQLRQLFGDDVEIQKFVSVDQVTEDNVKVLRLNYETINIDGGEFEAGVPYMIKPSKNIPADGILVEGRVHFTAPQAGSVTHEYKGDLFTFKALYSPVELEAGNKNVWFFTASGMKTPGTTSSIRPFRAYIEASKALVVDAMKMNLSNGTTGVETIKFDVNKGSNSKIYSLDGREIGKTFNSLQKGVYINKGKKILVK